MICTEISMLDARRLRAIEVNRPYLNAAFCKTTR